VREEAGVPLSGLTTLRLGGPARRLVTAHTEDELVRTVVAADRAGEPLLLLGGGSNLVVADEGFDGLVVRIAVGGVDRQGPTWTVAAGEDWDALVARTVAAGWSGLEAMSGVPGLVGATPVQNVGAYGQDVAQTVTGVRVLDRTTGEVRTMSPGECRFSYRDSVFKGSSRYVVLAVTYVLSAEPGPVRYAELVRRLEVEPGSPAPPGRVRGAVLELRRGKGMVLDEGDHDTWSAGSFFTNPVLAPETAAEVLPDGAPRWPEPDGRVKASAAWLIERSGFGKGYGSGPVRVSAKHTLALTNRGGARTADLVALAREIRSGVRNRFGIELEHEPVLVGCAL
jgi:UDP-N-acetylmuramate dehydrogenase